MPNYVFEDTMDRLKKRGVDEAEEHLTPYCGKEESKNPSCNYALGMIYHIKSKKLNLIEKDKSGLLWKRNRFWICFYRQTLKGSGSDYPINRKTIEKEISSEQLTEQKTPPECASESAMEPQKSGLPKKRLATVPKSKQTQQEGQTNQDDTSRGRTDESPPSVPVESKTLPTKADAQTENSDDALTELSQTMIRMSRFTETHFSMTHTTQRGGRALLEDSNGKERATEPAMDLAKPEGGSEEDGRLNRSRSSSRPRHKIRGAVQIVFGVTAAVASIVGLGICGTTERCGITPLDNSNLWFASSIGLGSGLAIGLDTVAAIHRNAPLAFLGGVATGGTALTGLWCGSSPCWSALDDRWWRLAVLGGLGPLGLTLTISGLVDVIKK
jgi:hypothetical protein